MTSVGKYSTAGMISYVMCTFHNAIHKQSESSLEMRCMKKGSILIHKMSLIYFLKL